MSEVIAVRSLPGVNIMNIYEPIALQRQRSYDRDLLYGDGL